MSGRTRISITFTDDQLRAINAAFPGKANENVALAERVRDLVAGGLSLHAILWPEDDLIERGGNREGRRPRLQEVVALRRDILISEEPRRVWIPAGAQGIVEERKREGMIVQFAQGNAMVRYSEVSILDDSLVPGESDDGLR